MPRVVAFEDAKARQFRGRETSITPFLESSAEAPHRPVAFLSQGDLARAIEPHWHGAEEFQIIAEGSGIFGHHAVSPFYVHYARACTPYGPLLDDGQHPIAFFTLRTRFDPGGPRYMPQTRDELYRIPNRRPWQVSSPVSFGAPAAGGVAMQDVPAIKDDQGLFVCTLSMAANARTTAPDPARGGGQYLVIVKGSLWHEDREHRSYIVVYVQPGEDAFPLRAGAQGLEAIVMNFPRAVSNK